MDGQVDQLEKIINEIQTKEKPIKLIFVDWASEMQHRGNKTPLRDIVDYPVLQSAFWSKLGSFHNKWCGNSPEQLRDMMKGKSVELSSHIMFVLDSNSVIVGRLVLDGKDFSDKNVYTKVKSLISKSIKDSKESKETDTQKKKIGG